jgi:hypothetical protein
VFVNCQQQCNSHSIGMHATSKRTLAGSSVLLLFLLLLHKQRQHMMLLPYSPIHAYLQSHRQVNPGICNNMLCHEGVGSAGAKPPNE